MTAEYLACNRALTGPQGTLSKSVPITKSLVFLRFIGRCEVEYLQTVYTM